VLSILKKKAMFVAEIDFLVKKMFFLYRGYIFNMRGESWQQNSRFVRQSI